MVLAAKLGAAKFVAVRSDLSNRPGFPGFRDQIRIMDVLGKDTCEGHRGQPNLRLAPTSIVQSQFSKDQGKTPKRLAVSWKPPTVGANERFAGLISFSERQRGTGLRASTSAKAGTGPI